MGEKKKKGKGTERKSHQVKRVDPGVAHVTDASEPGQDLEVKENHVQGHVPDHATNPRDLIGQGQNQDTVHVAKLDVRECVLDLETAQGVHGQDLDLMQKDLKTRVKTKRKILAVIEVEVEIGKKRIKIDPEIKTEKRRKKIEETKRRKRKN